MSVFKKLTESKFVRNVAIVAGGTAMSQLIGVIFTPIITRIYGPEPFGLMGTFESLAVIASSVSALTYPTAIVLPKKDSEAKNIARLSMYIAIGIASLAAILILIAGDSLFSLLEAQTISAFAMLVPLHMFFSAWLRVEQQWLVRKKQFKTTAKVLVAKAFILNTAKTVVGLFRPVASTLIVILTMGIGLQALMTRFVADYDKKKNKVEGNDDATADKQNKKSTSPSLIQTAKKYHDFPLYRAPVVFIEDLSASMPVLMLAATFGPAAAGFYVLGVKMLKAPSRLIGKSVSTVFYPKITKAAHDGKDIQKLIINATLGLAAAGFLPHFLVILFGPWIFKFVFGAEWLIAGKYAQWIAFAMFFQFITRPSSVAIITIGLQKEYMIYELIRTVAMVGGLYAGFSFFKSDLVAVAIFSSIGVLTHVSLMAWVVVTSKNKQKRRF